MQVEKKTLSRWDTQPWRHIVRYILAFVTGLVGVSDMLSVFMPKISGLLQLWSWPMMLSRTQLRAQMLTVVVGFFLIMLSYGLARGKRQAWGISIALLLISAIFLHVLRGGSILATLTALALALLIACSARFFQARSDPPSLVRGYIALLLGLGIVVFYAIGGFLALFGDLEPISQRIGFTGLILHIFTRAHLHVPITSPAFIFAPILRVLCLSAVLYGMSKIFRPVASVFLPERHDRHKVWELTRLYGRSSISYFALTDEKSYFFTASRRIVISYVLVGSTAVVVGDPIGPEAELPGALSEFMEYCTTQDWAAVFWQVRSELLTQYRAVGLYPLKIGEDAILNLQSFTLKGGAMANVRSSAKRAEKESIRVVFYQNQVTDAECLLQMEAISQRWLDERGGSEMGFSMGHFDPLGLGEQIYAVAVDERNSVHAFVSFVPIYSRNGWGLDLMRRAEQPAPGTMELLLVRSIEYLKNMGATMMSLGLAPLSNVNIDDDTFLGTSIDFLTTRFGDPAKNQSLFNFKKKFHPVWESRFLVYSGALSLPKIGWALYRAHQDVSMLGAVRQTIAHKLRQRRLKRLTLPKVAASATS
ncbi:bifunctional lysylphosphatidylglycerol flippase/synthetase MprF [Ktedonospora formicarum]|uniref:Phosphatidylglycerol lysyltransferase C-terminal domain-containing protein n=1 Tax=Ktedonospora formicarum TaxID=2778364 RepID=A0A8J3I004_9CHLR|nr:phosphatidylglycerol lysyltransferase domain-containing protein [Ktedonospora formicarum]GHO43608.1 hypothetical protein KSX_17710 [Ktedonospora formicarum]